MAAQPSVNDEEEIERRLWGELESEEEPEESSDEGEGEDGEGEDGEGDEDDRATEAGDESGIQTPQEG